MQKAQVVKSQKTTTKRAAQLKSIALFFTVVISQLPSLFYGTQERINLSLFVERSTRLDFFAMYYGNALNFLILSYCLYKPEGVDRRVRKIIFIVTLIDLLHLVFFASQKFGVSKIAIAVFIYVIIEFKRGQKWHI